MYQGMVLFYVGAVLILNGLWMRGRIADREVPPINLFVGGLSLLVALRLALGGDADAAAIRSAAFSLLFALTYLWVAYNRFTGSDGRGLGWFSLFVAITAGAIAAEAGWRAQSAWEAWEALSWAAWAVLWLLYFAVLVRGRAWQRQTALLAIAEGVATGWLPGYLLLAGHLG